MLVCMASICVLRHNTYVAQPVSPNGIVVRSDPPKKKQGAVDPSNLHMARVKNNCKYINSFHKEEEDAEEVSRNGTTVRNGRKEIGQPWHYHIRSLATIATNYRYIL
jgi:hypothetical protein